MRAFVHFLVVCLFAAGCAGASNGDLTQTDSTLASYPYQLADPVYSVERITGLQGLDTQSITIWAPDAEGAFPVVYAIHGLGGSAENWEPLGTVLAERGVIMAAADHRSVRISTPQWMSVYEDVECGYRFVRDIVADYGGDLDQPVAVVGYSLGATLALATALDDRHGIGSTGDFDKCPPVAPRPDVVIAIAGCHYAFQNNQFEFDPSVAGWSNQDVPLVLMVGSEDDVCEPWQTSDAAEALRADGYAVTLFDVAGADHDTVIQVQPGSGDDPGGLRTASVILDAIEASRS